MGILILSENEQMICPRCNAVQSEKAKYYVIENEVGLASICEDRCSACAGFYEACREPVGDNGTQISVVSSRVQQVAQKYTTMDKVRDFVRGVKTWHLIAVTFIWLSILFQPWETPNKKVAEEWKACNTNYADKCTYAGTRFHTEEFEMWLSETIYGKVDLKKLRKL